MSQTSWRIAVILGALCVLIGRGEAQEYCVVCSQPNAVYRCIIEGAKPGGSQPLQMLCVTAMLKEGRHTNCSPKGGTVFDCNGPIRKVQWAAHNASTLPPPKQETSKQPTRATDQPPKTVEEMAKRANEKSAEDLKKTSESIKDQTNSLGQNLGDATKKTWQCVTTLFSRCGE